MNSIEKFDRLLDVVPPKDRRDIPVYPMILTWCGMAGGYTQAEITSDPKKWMDSLDKTYQLIGKPDVYMSTCAGDVIFVMGLSSRRPGIELGENELYQFVETSHMELEDYKRIAASGWDNWYNKYLMSIQKPAMKKNFQLIMRFIKMGGNMGKIMKRFSGQGMAPIYHSAMAPAFDILSMVRSMQEFCYDLIDEPGLVQDAVRAATPAIINTTITNVKRAKGNRTGIFAMRSSGSFISPDMFGEFVWPSLKETIEAFYKAGIRSVLHADGDWLPMLHYLKQAPKGSVHVELDGLTDIRKAHAVLDGWQSLRGDVPATMLAFGTADEVSQYCESLIADIGMKGGFMLGSGCEVPLNAKLENVKAMVDAVR